MNLQSTATHPADEHRPEPRASLADEVMNAGDPELEDLIFSWRRVSDPKLRRVALQLVRSMAS